jgi:malate permease and related proteins
VLAVGVLQAAMAPMVSTAILAAQYKLDYEVANMALGAGLVISLASVPAINSFLS